MEEGVDAPAAARVVRAESWGRRREALAAQEILSWCPAADYACIKFATIAAKRIADGTIDEKTLFDLKGLSAVADWDSPFAASRAFLADKSEPWGVHTLGARGDGTTWDPDELPDAIPSALGDDARVSMSVDDGKDALVMSIRI